MPETPAMMAHHERDNSGDSGATSLSALPLATLPLSALPPAQSRILYLGRSMATAESLRALLRDGLLAPNSYNGQMPPTAGAAGAHTGPVLEIVASPVSYTHLRAHETVLDLVCRLLLEKKTT